MYIYYPSPTARFDPARAPILAEIVPCASVRVWPRETNYPARPACVSPKAAVITVYCKLFEVEKFRGWTTYFKFAGKLSRFVHPGQKCAHVRKRSLIERICYIIPNNYMYPLSRFLSLADIARQCGCKIVSSGKSHNVA